ncbi:MAG: hypothetical protein COZ06_14380 [Armatimonadetes bacterium CG_4_10_14_3_um_filter_66_18]|nr:MAG: hypothetical protein COZ57_34505 [Armatimonadetes bacterium CG_4_8_14_3_um_filter_66_20]PIY49320.1 MAG: hypothetical protein COZ06_14380 [Armatimonadetes bacterium CG_4_10_14_3_um_filter_66_18]PIZ48605.1 MAG: hypothetical protein COY42_06085 [Armatimonadetes bacterium CG_4_10_14_0_8_um_filter_66_14]
MPSGCIAAILALAVRGLLAGEPQAVTRPMEVDWSIGTPLEQVLREIHRQSGLQVAAAFGPKKGLDGPIRGSLPLAQLMNEVATATSAHWWLESERLNLVTVHDTSPALSRLALVRHWWSSQLPTIRDALLQGRVVPLGLHDPAHEPLLRLASDSGRDMADWTGDEVRMSLNYDLEVLLYHQTAGPDGRRLYRVQERVLPSAGCCECVEGEGRGPWRGVADPVDGETPAGEAPVKLDGFGVAHREVQTRLGTHRFAVPDREAYTLKELLSDVSAQSDEEFVPNRLDADVSVFLTERDWLTTDLVAWLQESLGADIARVGGLVYVRTHPSAPLHQEADFSSVDALRCLTSMFSGVVSVSDVERLGIPFPVADVRAACFHRASGLTDRQREWIDQALCGTHFDAARQAAHRRALRERSPLLHVRVLPRFVLRLGAYRPVGHGRWVSTRFVDIPLDAMRTVPEQPFGEATYYRRLAVRESYIREALLACESGLDALSRRSDAWPDLASGLVSIARRKYAPYAERLLQEGSTEVREAAMEALAAMSPPKPDSGLQERRIKELLPQLSSGDPEAASAGAMALGHACAMLARDNPLGDVPPVHQEALELLEVTALRAGNEGTAWAAKLALCAARRTPPSATDVVPLREALQHRDPVIARWALEALRTRFDNQGATISPNELLVLVEAIRSPRCTVRGDALRVLGRSGEERLLHVFRECQPDRQLTAAAITGAVGLLNRSLERRGLGDSFTFEAFTVHQRSLDLGTGLQKGVFVPELYLLGIAATPESDAARVLSTMGVDLAAMGRIAREAIVAPAFQRRFDTIRSQGESDDGPNWWTRKPILRPSQEWDDLEQDLAQRRRDRGDWRVGSLDILECLLLRRSTVVDGVLTNSHGVTPDRVKAVAAALEVPVAAEREGGDRALSSSGDYAGPSPQGRR